MIDRLQGYVRGMAVAALVAFSGGHLGAATAQDAFFATVADLPLMPGLAEQQDTALVFDNPGGRIVEVTAVGSLTAEAISAFYGETLPQLGWTGVADDQFEREGEVLRLVFTQVTGPTVVLFTIAPLAPPGP
ncbi:MAG: hypothetical protein HOB82_04470 [Alphaproteobacteria bacterium]|jgi:hypothetical protein|nr:hypothetical protein [Alphaproteobacteria bacterium]MBT4710764.1 hypothetical protein [Alphaproteobacteria bacterium]